MNQPDEDQINTTFQTILSALDSCGHIGQQLNIVDQCCTIIKDHHLVELIEDSREVNSILRNASFKDSYTKILDQSNELESILNIPSELDDCLYNRDTIHQAVNLLERVEKLHLNYGHEATIVENLYKYSESRREYIVSELCDMLEQIKRPSQNEIKFIVNLLSRCGNFSDRELRLKYLQARDNWFNAACEENESSFDNVVSVHCEGLPMIYQEYRSLFVTDRELADAKFSTTSISDKDKEDGAIINSWLLLKASIFVSSVEVYLKLIHDSDVKTPTMIGDTMKNCFELTDKLCVIGFDFSSQLTPLFTKAIVEEVKLSVEKATLKFEKSFMLAVTKSVESLLLPIDDEILRISNMRPDEQLPKSIEHYPIFKVYLLHLIDSLRWIQVTRNLLSPVGLCLDIYAALNGSLLRIVNALAMVINMDDNSNNIHLTKIAISLVTEVLPFIVNYCEKIFPEKIILSAIGLTKSEFKTISSKEPERLKNFRLNSNDCVTHSLLRIIGHD